MENNQKIRNVPISTNSFYVLAEKYRKSITSENEIEKENRTELFFQEIEKMIINGEIVIININAKMRLGKSTEAIMLGCIINDMLIKHKQKSPNDSFGMKNIARDQQEKSKIMRDSNVCNTVIVTDEENELENGGENASANEALNNVFSSVQAARYVHAICCSPKSTVDPNADIMLSVIAINKEQLITRNKLYYRYYEGGNEYIQLLGYVDICVKPLIENWENNVKNIFRKTVKTPEEIKFIEEEMKKDFYIEYMVKKHEKMELITKEGIFRPRMLDNAQIILDICEELSPMAQLGTGITSSIVRSYVKEHMRKHKIPMSMFGEKLATEDVLGVLDLYKAQQQIKKELALYENKIKAKQIDYATYTVLKEESEKIFKSLSNSIKNRISELQNLKEINQRYTTIVSE